MTIRITKKIIIEGVNSYIAFNILNINILKDI